MGKFALESSFTGQQGVNLIATIVGEMHHLWNPSAGHSDVGIDGYIDLCKPKDGKWESTNQIVQVQSKATAGQWQAETDESFSFKVEEKDLEHWLSSNSPVILVVSRPSTNEIYWVPIKEYFASFEARKSRKIQFIKNLHRFSAQSNLHLFSLFEQTGSNYQPITLKHEELLSNILPVASYPPTIYQYQCNYDTAKSLIDDARKLNIKIHNRWIIKSGSVFSFSNLSTDWNALINSESKRTVSASSWALSKDKDFKRNFVQLLNQELIAFMGRKRIWRQRRNSGGNLYFFAPDEKVITRTEIWGDRGSSREVVSPIYAKTEPGRVVCYKHNAVIASFVEYGKSWNLLIEPTYHYTYDGSKESSFREEYLKGMKRIEKNQAFSNNIRFWINQLSSLDLFDLNSNALSFSPGLVFNVSFGISDNEWNRKNPWAEEVVEEDFFAEEHPTKGIAYES